METLHQQISEAYELASSLLGNLNNAESTANKTNKVAALLIRKHIKAARKLYNDLAILEVALNEVQK